MTFGQVILLGVVQGLTEFLPISSDGHLALMQNFLRMQEASLALDVALHVGTLGSMLFFFRKDLGALARGVWTGEPAVRSRETRRLVYIGLATVFTGAVGFSLKPYVEAYLYSLTAAGAGFLVTTLFLLGGEWAFRRNKTRLFENIPWWHLVVLGIVQGAAVWPGWSRSGSTIGAALLLGWRWEDAGRFSFLMAIPAIAGATLLLARDIVGLNPGVTIVGAAVAFVTGCASLYVLMKFLAARCLWPFAVYCGVVGIWAVMR
jgi:undecaprenyl-diphosphatase